MPFKCLTLSGHLCMHLCGGGGETEGVSVCVLVVRACIAGWLGGRRDSDITRPYPPIPIQIISINKRFMVSGVRPMLLSFCAMRFVLLFRLFLLSFCLQIVSELRGVPRLWSRFSTCRWWAGVGVFLFLHQNLMISCKTCYFGCFFVSSLLVFFFWQPATSDTSTTPEYKEEEGERKQTDVSDNWVDWPDVFFFYSPHIYHRAIGFLCLDLVFATFLAVCVSQFLEMMNLFYGLKIAKKINCLNQPTDVDKRRVNDECIYSFDGNDALNSKIVIHFESID